MALNLLSDSKLKAIRVSSAPQKISYGGGLYLLVKPNGAKLWRLKYRYAGVERLLALGAYPEVSLRRTREKRSEAHRLLDEEKDPALTRRLKKQTEHALCGVLKRSTSPCERLAKFVTSTRRP